MCRHHVWISSVYIFICNHPLTPKAVLDACPLGMCAFATQSSTQALSGESPWPVPITVTLFNTHLIRSQESTNWFLHAWRLALIIAHAIAVQYTHDGKNLDSGSSQRPLCIGRPAITSASATHSDSILHRSRGPES